MQSRCNPKYLIVVIVFKKWKWSAGFCNELLYKVAYYSCHLTALFLLHWLAYKWDDADAMMTKNRIMNSKKIWVIVWKNWKYFFGIDVIITSCVGMLCMKRANIELRLISKGLLRWIDGYTVIMIIIHVYNFLRRGNNIVGMPKKKMKMTKKIRMVWVGFK